MERESARGSRKAADVLCGHASLYGGVVVAKPVPDEIRDWLRAQG